MPDRALALEVIAAPSGGAMRDQPTNAIIIATDEISIVDPSTMPGVALIQAALARCGAFRVKANVLTHGHHAHTLAAPMLKRLYNCPLMLNPEERPILPPFLDWSDIDLPLMGAMSLVVDGGKIEMLAPPGHSPGHVSLYERASRTFAIFPLYGTMTDYLHSLAVAQRLDARTISPGHGPTMTQEKMRAGHKAAPAFEDPADARWRVTGGR